MKKLFLLFLLGSSVAYGQRNFSIEETVFGLRQFATQRINAVKWIPGTDVLSQLDASYQNLQKRDTKSNWAAVPLVSAKELTGALQAVLSAEKEIKLSYFPLDYSWVDKNTFSFTYESAQWTYQLRYQVADKKAVVVSKWPSDANNPESNPGSPKTAYLVGNNIEIIDEAGNQVRVTNDTIDGIVNGSDYTHRQEFGITKGMWWSADNTKLLYYRKDETMVSPYPLVQWGERVANVRSIRYPMAGMKSEEVTLVVFDTRSKKKVILKTGQPKEQYLTICTWDPSGDFVYVGVLNREQNHLKLNKYDVKTGEFVKTLFEEQSSSWVEPQHALLFLPGAKNQFLYQTDKEGFNQLYLYDTEGRLIRSLGYQDVIVEELHDFTADGKRLTYTGITNEGLDRQLFEVEIGTGKTKQLTTGAGTHQGLVSTTGKYIYDEYSNLETPYVAAVKSVSGKLIQTLLQAEDPFVGKINLPKIEPVSLLSADGKTPLNGRLIYPPNFDASKKYPVMVYLYGGSHAQLVQNKWLYGAGYFDLYMAQNGYVVFTMDNRGSDARGRDFTRVTHRQLGQAEMADQLQGVEFLKSKPFVDTARLGIFGWSFGGFMTSSFMVQHPGIFHTAVAGGPVIDWKFYEVMYGERYMDTPAENPEGYQKTSLLNKADQLKGNLLIIHGAQDPVVVQQHSMEFVEACIKAGKKVDYFLYPTHEHNVMGKDRVHMYDKIAKYFDIHLKKN
ncbi:DPP IV N-terminal domain-containing protein [Sphingobacterium sp. LRF_L2]|uniref:S9 family peptidase n=1 Tax=Sphingobacterium sp. LRF_L2 TaxID=3369421 RepID=UPI003F5F6518